MAAPRTRRRTAPEVSPAQEPVASVRPVPPEGAQPDLRRLRKFGLVVGGVFALLAAYLVRRGGGVTPAALLLAAVGSPLLVLGALAPRLLAVPERVWMRVGGALGHVNALLLLSAVYYLAFTPISLLMRVLRKDPLALRIDRGRKSYWNHRPKDLPPDRYTRQF